MADRDESKHLTSLSSKNLLGNFTAFDIDGEFLFNCDHKKANWYVNKKNLAAWINPEQTHFQLNFIPKGNGNRDLGKYFTEYIANQCVICGIKENLSKHHIVPSCYRTHFPIACKSNDHFDVLLVCLECHENIEEHYTKRKKSLNADHRKALEPAYNDHKTVNSLIRTANKYQDVLDEEAKNTMVESAKKIDPLIDNFQTLLLLDLFDIAGNLDREVCEKVVNDERDDLKGFIVEWRTLFIEKAKPKFLPEGWLDDYQTHFKF